MAVNAPAIDILLAVYNGEKYLPAFLDSLLEQSQDNFRLVVSDNKSTDGTPAILRDYARRFMHGLVVLSVPPETVSAPRNFARVTQAAEAPYIMYADADDVWRSDKVERSLSALKAMEVRYGAETPLLVHSDLAVVDRNLKMLHPSYWSYQNIDPSRTHLSQLLIRNCVTGCTVMMNRTLLALIRPIPEAVPMHDYWCAVNAAAFGHIGAIAEPLIAYRQHGANDTGAAAWGAGFILRRLASLSSVRGPRSRFRAKAVQARLLLERHGDRLNSGDRKTAQAVATLFEAGWLTRRWRIFRYGLWDAGLVRNIGMFLCL
jgi:glycosyltransferase involved in cell wall biosynthesis